MSGRTGVSPQERWAAYLMENPGTEVDIRIGGLEYASAELESPDQSLVARRLLIHRAVDVSPPNDCQTVWLPAN